MFKDLYGHPVLKGDVGHVGSVLSPHMVGFIKPKTDGSTRLTYTGLCGELEHLKIETRLIEESFECVMGECVI